MRRRLLPLAPLHDATKQAIAGRVHDGGRLGGGISEAVAAAHVWAVSERQSQRWAQQSDPEITVYLAERIAHHLGRHPAEIWPQYVDMFAGPLKQQRNPKK